MQNRLYNKGELCKYVPEPRELKLQGHDKQDRGFSSLPECADIRTKTMNNDML